jgi:hypothetical protein
MIQINENIKSLYSQWHYLLSFEDMNERKLVYVDGREIISVNIGANPVKQRLLSATGTITGEHYHNLITTLTLIDPLTLY